LGNPQTVAIDVEGGVEVSVPDVGGVVLGTLRDGDDRSH